MTRRGASRTGAHAAVRRDIAAVCGRLYDRGLIAGPDGNVSVRIGPRLVLVTPSGMSKADVRPSDVVEVSVTGARRAGSRRASSELAVHLRIYSLRPDVRAVVHAHPPVATGFAVSGEGFPPGVLPEIILQVGEIPLVPYERPGTEALADRCAPFAAGHDAFLLANHGAVTVGPSLGVAHQRMESLEHTARILLTARLLGRVNELPPAAVAALLATRADGGAASDAGASRAG